MKTQDIKAYDFYIRGRHYYRSLKNKFKLAIEMFQKAIQKDPNYALAYAGLADCYSYIYLWFQLDKEILDQAFSASQKALELDPDLAEAHISHGLTMAIKSEYDEAEKAFEKAIHLNPQLFEAYYQFGRTCMGQGKHEQAQKLFEKASQLQPDNYESAILLAATYRETDGKTEWKNQCRKAVTVTRSHLDLYPEDTRALCLGAVALAGTGESKEAIKWIEKALTLEPNEMTVLYNATCTYSLLGKYDRALDLFEQRTKVGTINRGWLDNDADLDPIRNHPRFQKALKKLRASS